MASLQKTDKHNRKQSPQIKLLVIVLVIVLCIVMAGLALFFKAVDNSLSRPSIPRATIESNESLWQDANITNYTITMFGGSIVASDYTFTIIDGQIVDGMVDGVEIPANEFGEYERYTVEGLFEQAYTCSHCSATFHPDYGFPTEIHGGWFESWGLTVTDFQPLAEIEAIPED